MYVFFFLYFYLKHSETITQKRVSLSLEKCSKKRFSTLVACIVACTACSLAGSASRFWWGSPKRCWGTVLSKVNGLCLAMPISGRPRQKGPSFMESQGSIEASRTSSSAQTMPGWSNHPQIFK